MHARDMTRRCFQLAEPVRTSPYQSPIAFATSDTPVGERAVISGWGRIRTFSFLSRSLQKLSLPIIDNKACQEYYSNTTILSSQICTLERKGVGACKVSAWKSRRRAPCDSLEYREFSLARAPNRPSIMLFNINSTFSYIIII